MSWTRTNPCVRAGGAETEAEILRWAAGVVAGPAASVDVMALWGRVWRAFEKNSG